MNKKILRTLILAAAVALPTCALANAGLMSSFQKAMKHDPDYAVARASYEADSQYRTIGRAGLLPSLDISAYKNKTDYEYKSTTWNDTDYDTGSFTLRLAQPLFDLEKWASYREGDVRAESAAIVFADARQELALRVAEVYFNYLLALDTAELATAQKTAISAQRERAENLFKGGAATRTDVEESKAREQLAQAQELTAITGLEQSRKTFAKVIGDDPARLDLKKITAPELALPKPNDINVWMDAVRKQNLKIQSYQAAFAIADYQLDRSRAGFFPKFSLYASRDRSEEPNYYNSREYKDQVGIQMSMNLFNGGATYGATKQASALREKARHTLTSVKRDMEIEANQAFLEIVNGIARIHAYEQAVTSSEVTLRGMKAGQKAGIRTNTDVLDAQQELFSSKLELQKARYGYLLSKMTLQALTGSLGDEEIMAVDRMALPSLEN